MGETGGKEKGEGGLKSQPAPGSRPKLTAEQQQQIPGLLEKGAEAYGFRGEVWTTKRVADVVARKLGVRYHHNHIGKILRKLGWSVQQPQHQATQRKADEVQEWWDERWPAIKKS